MYDLSVNFPAVHNLMLMLVSNGLQPKTHKKALTRVCGRPGRNNLGINLGGSIKKGEVVKPMAILLTVTKLFVDGLKVNFAEL